MAQFHRYPVFSSLLTATIALLSSLHQTNASECDSESRLHNALLEHDKARIEFRYKMQTGYIRSAGRGDITIARNRNEFLYDGPHRTLQAIQKHLESLDERAGTYALVFEPSDLGECVWLIGPDHLGSARRLQTQTAEGESRFIAHDFRKILNVDIRARDRLPKRRNRTGPDQVAPVVSPPAAGTDELHDPLALRRAVIPDVLMREIELSARSLLILPVDDLSAVPFAALTATQQGKYLIDYSSTLVLPSVDGLFFWVKMSAFRDFHQSTIVGDPNLSEDPEYEFIPLPGAKEEAETVAQLAGTDALIGDKATYDDVLEKLNALPHLIYFATHGIADATNPMDASFLALRGRHLYAAQIKRLRYPSHHPLVVMSACQTGLGKTFASGVFGLARAWIYAGAAQVLASQWNVNDAATAVLMTAFMTSMSQGSGSQLAFRQAMQETREKYEDPALWGSFNLFGYPQPGG